VGRADTCDLALPDEDVSRTHCFLDRSREGVITVVDRSRHGTWVNGERVSRADLSYGDHVRVGGFTLEILEAVQEDRTPTAPGVADRSFEELVGADNQGIEVVALSLKVVGGPAQGLDFPISAPEVTVGSSASRVEIRDPSLLPRHFKVHTNRGRAMVQPLSGTVLVDGQRVRGLFPLMAGETFEAGGSQFQLVGQPREEHPERASFGDMIGESPSIKRVFGMLHRMAAHDETVLLLGESGTGKELAARGLHDLGPRASGPFVPVNCGAIAENLFESELFGHEKGAFTGAVGRRNGAFQMAHGGTLFLDEVGEIPLGSQAKLLRALESGEVRRVGGQAPEYPDVRVVAATNRNLIDEVKKGAFREDLYFRLAVLTIRLPPLREKLADLPLLCRALCAGLGPDVFVTPDALKALAQHPWPGNVRELRNVLVRAYVLGGPRIDVQNLSLTPLESQLPPMAADGLVTEEAERAFFQSAIHRHRGNRASLARELGLPRTTLIYKLRRLGLD
jgi:transcriptional regulator with AAA-type ATPase domain